MLLKLIIAAVALLSAAITVSSIILNFNEFLVGSPATMKSIIVAFVYIAIWVIVIVTGGKVQSVKLIKYSIVFWLLTLLTAAAIMYANAADAIVDWAIPFAILFISPLYGLDIFADNFLITSIIIAVLSLVMISIAVSALRRIGSLNLRFRG